MKMNERVGEKEGESERERKRKREEGTGENSEPIKDFSDEEMRDMREWPNSFTDLRSRYLVLKIACSHSSAPQSTVAIDRSISGAGDRDRRRRDGSRRPSRAGVCHEKKVTRVLRCILTLKNLSVRYDLVL